MKRTLSVLLLFILLTSSLLLQGCGAKKSIQTVDNTPIVVEVWHYYNGPQKIAFDNLVNEFNETVGIREGIVVDTISQGNVTDLTSRVIDSANKKIGAYDIPDIFAAYADTAYEIDKMGLAADIAPYLTHEELDEYLPSYIEEGRIGNDESLKIFPIAKSTEIFMLNKTDWDNFKNAVGASEDSFTTMEGIAAVAEDYYNWTDSLTEKADDGKAFFGRDAMANYFIIGSKELGIELFSVQNGKAVLNCEETVMRKLWDNYYIPYINGYFASYGKFRSDDAKTGDIIALVGSTSATAYFPNEVIVNDTESYPIETATFPAPGFKEGNQYAVQQGAGMVITKSNKEKEQACVEFLKWLTDVPQNVSFSIESGYLPVKKAANNEDILMKALSELPADKINKNLEISLPVSCAIVNTKTLYTNKAFENGSSARNILEYSMSDKAKEDRETVKAEIKQGISRKEAVSQFETEENFQKWFHEFKEELQKTVG